MDTLQNTWSYVGSINVAYPALIYDCRAFFQAPTSWKALLFDAIS